MVKKIIFYRYILAKYYVAMGNIRPIVPLVVLYAISDTFVKVDVGWACILIKILKVQPAQTTRLPYFL